MAKLSVEIVTAERQVLAEQEVDMVVAPGAEGSVGILPRHAPLLTTLRPGVIRIRKGEGETAMAVSGGFFQVNADRVLVLADVAEREEEIDEARAEESRRRAEAALTEATRGGTAAQVEAARTALRLSLARMQIAQRRRRRPQP